MSKNINYIKEASSLLKKYRQVTDTLFSEYKVYNRSLFSKECVNFNTNISLSLNYLYKTSIPLYKALKSYNNNYDYKKRRYYSFYYDFIVSKPSSTIFTETPKDVKVNLFPLTPKGIAEQNYFLFKLIQDYKLNNELSNETSWWKKIINFFRKISYGLTKLNLQDETRKNFESTFDTYFQIFFMRTFLYYDFIFYKDKGVFAKYTFKKEDTVELFERIKEVFLRFLESENTDKREFYFKAIIVAINEAFPENKRKVDYKIDDIEHHEIYKKYVLHQEKYIHYKDKLIKFEPFTYVLANKIWKFDRIYQNRLEGADDSQNYHKLIKKYIVNSLNTFDKYYRGNISRYELFGKIALLDKEVINSIYEKYLADIDNADTRMCQLASKPENQDSDKAEGQKDQTPDNADTDENNEKSSSLDDIIKYMYDTKKHEKLKFHRILEKAKKNDLEVLTNAFYDMINKELNKELNKEGNKKCDIYYIGILRSGSFLAHIVNIMSKNEKPAFSVITHPYLSILPRKKFLRKANDSLRIVYIDEAIKTGYSVQIVDTYRAKFLIDETVKDCESYLFTLVDVANFKKSIEKTILYHSLRHIKIENEEIEVVGSEVTQPNALFKWEDFLNNLSDLTQKNNLTKFSETVKKLAEEEQGETRYDLTKVIGCSHYLFTIGKYFANKLNKATEVHQKEILMYAGSSEGKLLADVTTFVYKILYGSDKKFCLDPKYKNEKDVEEAYRCFFDISIVSGSTMEKVKRLDAKNKEFDQIFVIAKEKNVAEENIIHIFEFNEKPSLAPSEENGTNE